ncbi:hypothetical protein ES319_D12G121300v1, partial [Gossypium barbadense]
FSFVLFIFLQVLKLNHARPSGKIRGKNPPPGQCNLQNVSNCCKDGKFYMTYKCSPPMLSSTKAMLTLNNFEAGGDGSGPSECNNQYHSNDYLVVALLTGWFNYGKRGLKYINIHSNGKSVRVKVVDECDSNYEYRLPYFNNIVDSSKAVWKALGGLKSD